MTWPIDRISPSTKSKIAKQLHRNSASSFGDTDKPTLESKVTYWSFCKSWSWTVSFFSQSLLLDSLSSFLAMYPDIVVATSELPPSKTFSKISSIDPIAFHQSFHNFHPRYPHVVDLHSKSLYPSLLVSDMIKCALSTSLKLTKNIPPLFWRYYEEWRSIGSFWSRTVSTKSCPSFSNSSIWIACDRKI